MKFKKRVRRGIKLLDKKAPPKWRNMVNAKMLIMYSAEDCVLAHIFGSYMMGCEELGLSDADVDEKSRYGFTLPPNYTSWDESLAWAKLTRRWIKELRK